jgi:hypothetical protein
MIEIENVPVTVEPEAEPQPAPVVPSAPVVPPMRVSRFDTGNWSNVNGLPGQDDMIRYLEYLLSADVDKCFSRRDLMAAVVNEFGIPVVAAEAEGPNSSTAGFYTRLTYLITDGVRGERRAPHQFMRRLGLSVYQHVHGNGVISPEFRQRNKVSRKEVSLAVPSVKLLRDLGQDKETIFCNMCDKTSWNEHVVEAAIRQVFGV